MPSMTEFKSVTAASSQRSSQDFSDEAALRKLEPLSIVPTHDGDDIEMATTAVATAVPTAKSELADPGPAVIRRDNAPGANPRPDTMAGRGRRESVIRDSVAFVLERVPTYLQPSMPVRERLRHFTFAWYTLTMSTSGVALVLGITPHRFSGLNYIGLVIFLIDLLFFAFITAALICRFVIHSGAFRQAITHPHEALFTATFFLSIAALLSSTAVYGRLFFAEGTAARTGLFRFLGVFFWIYLGITFLYAVVQYHMLFTVKPQRRLKVSGMTPGWILPIFPVMLAGTLAPAISPDFHATRALAIICAGLSAQGLGFLVSVFMFATYLSRLVAFGLPPHRPGMFIAVGPPSFTCAAFLAMASDMPRILFADPDWTWAFLLAGNRPAGGYPTSSASVAVLAAGIRLVANASAIFLWGLSVWFFSLAARATVGMPDRKFHLSWWSFVFPNVGFTIATIRLANALDSPGLSWIATAMTICLFVAWLFIGFRCILAVYSREIVWPGHDEDHEPTPAPAATSPA